MKRKKKDGRFRPGFDPRRHQFTRRERRKGYRNAMERLGQGDAKVYAWLYRKVRGYYRAERRDGRA